ncbi:MAG: restriction endonuclease subunit S [Thermosphaera sp.]
MNKIEFYKETNLKETVIGRVPKDWKVVSVYEILSLEYGKGLPEKERIIGEYPVVGSNGIVGYHNRSLVKGPGIVIGRKGTIGAVSWVEQDFWPIDTTYYVKLKKENVNWRWLYFALIKLNLPKLHLSDVVPGLKREIVYSLKVPFPPSIEEQRAIAEVLSVVDLAIQRTDMVIAKTERLKKGLMQTLLTRGIGHKEFKDTEIGKIPKTWQIVSISDVCKQRNEIVQPPVNNKEPLVGLEHIASGETRLRNYSQSADVKSAKFRFHRGDILYGKLRPYLDKAVIADFDGICSTDLLVLTSKENVLREFLIYVLHSNNFIKYAIATTRGTNHPRTSWSAISKFKFGLPERSEQQKIAEILSAADMKIEFEKKEKVRLELIKQGLMDLLLTGKVRVRVN